MSSEHKEEEEKTEEQLQLEETRRKAWENLNSFMEGHEAEMIDEVSFNAAQNLYKNDVANLDEGNRTSVSSESCKYYKEKISIIDLQTIGDRYLLSASWHCELDDIIVCTYLDKNVKSSSLVVLWSLLSPLQPKVILDCEEQVSTISFCPQKSYTNLIVGGCLSGKIIVWEINKHWLRTEEKLQNGLLVYV